MSDHESLTADRGVAVASRLSAERSTRGARDVPGEDSLVDELTIANDQLRDWVSGVVAGFPLIVPRGVIVERREGLGRTTIPFMRGLAYEAREQVSFAAAAKTPALRTAAIRKGGLLLQVAMAVTQASALKINLLMMASVADEAGEAQGKILGNVDAVDVRIMIPLGAAINATMRTGDVSHLVAARLRLEPDFELTRQRINKADDDLRQNQVLASRVILVADFLMLLHSVRQVYRTPTISPPGGPRAPLGPPGGGAVVGSGGAGTMTATVDIAGALEAIKKLIAIGALDLRMIAMIGAISSHQLAANLAGPTQMMSSKTPSPSAGKPSGGPPAKSAATPSVPQPAVFNRTLAVLKQYKVDVAHKYTLDKLVEIYMRNRNPEALLFQARAGSGELRVLIRHARQPGVRTVRFVPPTNVKGEHTPDIEIVWQKGKPTYVEVRTMTDAPAWMTVQQAKSGARAGVAATPEFINSINDKIRLGQLSAARPGTFALHAPHQVVAAESLEGWRSVIKEIRARGPMPPGVRRIEITGGTGPMLIFEAPDWKGLIVR